MTDLKSTWYSWYLKCTHFFRICSKIYPAFCSIYICLIEICSSFLLRRSPCQNLLKDCQCHSQSYFQFWQELQIFYYCQFTIYKYILLPVISSHCNIYVKLSVFYIYALQIAKNVSISCLHSLPPTKEASSKVNDVIGANSKFFKNNFCNTENTKQVKLIKKLKTSEY